MAPQLGGNDGNGGARRHNYSTKTRQAGRANEQSMYSLMSMDIILAWGYYKMELLNYHNTHKKNICCS